MPVYDETRSTGSTLLNFGWLATAAMGGVARWFSFDGFLDSVNASSRDLLAGRLAARAARL